MKSTKKHWTLATTCALLAVCVLLGSGCVHIRLPRRDEASTTGSSQTASLPVGECNALDLRVDEAVVLAVLTDENEVSASYNTQFNKVQIKEADGAVRVECTTKRKEAELGDPLTITLNVPKTVFDTVQMDVKSGFIGWRDLPSARIDSEIDNGMGVMVIPSDFMGTLDVRCDEGFLDIASQNEFKNCDVTGQTEEALMSGPSTFTRDRNTARYTNGTGVGVIRARVDSGYLRFDETDALANTMLDAAGNNLKDMRSFIQSLRDDMQTSAETAKENAKRFAHAATYSLDELHAIEDVYPETIVDEAADEYAQAVADAASAYAAGIEDAASEYAQRVEDFAYGLLPATKAGSSRLSGGIGQGKTALQSALERGASAVG